MSQAAARMARRSGHDPPPLFNTFSLRLYALRRGGTRPDLGEGAHCCVLARTRARHPAQIGCRPIEPSPFPLRLLLAAARNPALTSHSPLHLPPSSQPRKRPQCGDEHVDVRL